MRSPELIYDAIVVGGGPAGLAAALQLARFNRTVICFDSGSGRSTFHQINHNVLGFPGGIGIRELRTRAREQAGAYPIAFVDAPVESVAMDGDGHFLAAATGPACRALGRTVILATGVRDRFPAFPNWQDYVGRSIFWCIVCDGYSTRGKRIVVVGNDTDAGVTALQFLQFTDRVTVLTNADTCGLNPGICRALERHHVPLIVGEIAGVLGNGGVLGAIALKDGMQLPLDFLFSLQGCHPNSALARALGAECTRQGYIITDLEQRTSVPGMFAAGDVTRDLAHQVSTAMHEGNTAATSANYFLYAPDQRHEAYRERSNASAMSS